MDQILDVLLVAGWAVGGLVLYTLVTLAGLMWLNWYQQSKARLAGAPRTPAGLPLSHGAAQPEGPCSRRDRAAGGTAQPEGPRSRRDGAPRGAPGWLPGPVGAGRYGAPDTAAARKA